MRTVKYEALKPGMVCEDWDHADKVIAKVDRIERPSMKYDLVRVTFTDGSSTSATVAAKMNIR